MPYVIKAAISREDAKSFAFEAQKTMYHGKEIAVDDEVFVFSSENEGGSGLIARGVVTAATAARVELIPGKTRYTPRVSVAVKRTATARRPLGREQLNAFKTWDDGRPETELSFKFYRQATNKIAGISEDTARFLRTFF